MIPLSYLCFTNPAVKQDLLAWMEKKKTIFYSDSLDVWMLRREPTRPPDHPKIQQIIDLLEMVRSFRKYQRNKPVRLSLYSFVN